MNYSFIKTFECNRKLLLKPFKKLLAVADEAIPSPIIGAVEALSAYMYAFFARAFKSFSPVIVLLEGRQTERGKIFLKIGGEND